MGRKVQHTPFEVIRDTDVRPITPALTEIVSGKLPFLRFLFVALPHGRLRGSIYEEIHVLGSSSNT